MCPLSITHNYAVYAGKLTFQLESQLFLSYDGWLSREMVANNRDGWLTTNKGDGWLGNGWLTREMGSLVGRCVAKEGDVWL
jgi:hypothetical protein